MDPSRIALLVAVGVFLAWILYKLRPLAAGPDSDPPKRMRAEQRLYKRIRRLPPAAQRRLLARLQRDLEPDDAQD